VRAVPVLAAVAIAACSQQPPAPAPCPSTAALQAAAAGPIVDSQATPFDSAFSAAAAEFAVPRALLKSIGWVETRWQMVRGEEEFPGRAAAFGVMALRGTELERGAALAHVTADAVRHEALANIRAAAALLDGYATDEGIDRGNSEAWAGPVARLSGVDIAAGREAYLRDVNRVLAPERRLLPAPVQPAGPCPPPPSPPPDYAAAVWRPSPNFNARPADSTGLPHMIIIHTCESGYTSCWSWLVNPASQVSAHYVVNEDGSEISQLVAEPQRAWHIAALYDCTLNRLHDCWLNGVQGNDFTVGIEHAGFVSQDSFPASQLAASARLVCDVTRRRDIPRDWQHIVGHGQLQPQNRTDPGPHWPWVAFVHLVQADCGEVVVDDDGGFNDSSVADVSLPSNWVATVATPGYYGSGYHWAPTDPAAIDAAVFSFHLSAPARRTLDVRYTSGGNRSAQARYLVTAATGATLAVVGVDQRSGGGEWHLLGSWTFPAGWNRVVLSRRDSGGGVVVADALRVRE
jgi:N-acetyl-anhydromuramyl-L-alanine amidase AmpD